MTHISRRASMILACCAAITATILAAPFAGAATPPATGYWTWCQNQTTSCFWPQQAFGGTGTAWQASDDNWHNTAAGLRVADDDDSFMNYAQLSVAVFNDSGWRGGCEWQAPHGGYNEALGFLQNDDGSSHKRYQPGNSPC